MLNDFEIVTSERKRGHRSGIEVVEGEIVGNSVIKKDESGNNQLIEAVADNFDKIIDLAASIVEIQNMKVKANTYIAELEEKRKMLEIETDSYVKKMNAKTNSTINQVEIIRCMMQDYYMNGNGKLSSEEFSKIIQGLISKIGVADE
jgi:hypothetical protein